MTKTGLTGRDLRNAIIFAALVYLAIRFISAIMDIILIFSVSSLIAVVFDPFVTWLSKHRVPRAVSAMLIALSILGSVVLVAFLVIPRAATQVQSLAHQVPDFLDKAEIWIQQAGLARYLPTKLDINNISEISRPIVTGASRATASAAGALASGFLILVISIYLLSDPQRITDGLKKAISVEHRQRATAAGRRLILQIRAWALGVAIGMVSIFVLTWIALAVIGIKESFLFAVVAGILEAVPILGPVLATIPPALISLLSASPITAVWVIAAFVIIQQIEGHVLIPLVMSRQLSLHPVTVIFAVLVMGGLFGIVGIFLAAPAAVTAGILYDEFYLCAYRHECRESENESDTDSTG